MRVAAAQVHNTEDVRANKARAADLVARAADAGADLVVLPEMSILHFFPRIPHEPRFFELAEPLPGPTLEWFQALAERHRVHIVYNHYERSPERLRFDCSVVVDRQGRFVGAQRMMHLAEEPGYNEKFYYAPGWDDYKVFELDGWRFGLATCYDRHFPEVFRAHVLQGAEAVLIPTAVAADEPFAAVYELEARAAAVTHGVYIVMANRAGPEPPLTMIGRSMVVDPLGEVVAQLADEADAFALATLSKETLDRARLLFPFLRDRRPETYGIVAERPRSAQLPEPR